MSNYNIGDVVTWKDELLSAEVEYRIADVAYTLEGKVLYVLCGVSSNVEDECLALDHDTLVKLGNFKVFKKEVTVDVSGYKFKLGQMVKYREENIERFGMIIKRGVEDSNVLYTLKNSDEERPVILQDGIFAISLSEYYPTGIFEDKPVKDADGVVMGSITLEDLRQLTCGTELYYEGELVIITACIKQFPYFEYTCMRCGDLTYVDVDGRDLFIKPKKSFGLQ